MKYLLTMFNIFFSILQWENLNLLYFKLILIKFFIESLNFFYCLFLFLNLEIEH